MWANRLRDLQTGYFSESGIDKLTLEKLSDAMLAEQICNGLPELAKKYVLDKQAKTADECATEADRWFLEPVCVTQSPEQRPITIRCV